MNKKITKAHSEGFVSGALATVLRLSRFAGTAPLRFEKKENGWCISPSSSLSILGNIIGTIINVAIVAVLVTLGLEELIKNIHMDKSVDMQGIVRIIVFNVKALVIVALEATMVYSAPGHMRRMIVCLNQMQQINSILDIHYWPSQWTKKLAALFIFWGSVTSAISVVDMISSVILFLGQFQVWVRGIFIMGYFSYVAMQLRLMQYALLVLHVRSGFQAVNDCLRNVLNNLKIKHKQDVLLRSSRVIHTYIVSNAHKKVNTSHNITKSGSHECVRRAALAYASTCDVMRDVDRSQGLLVLMILASLFLNLITTAYYFIDNLTFDVTLSLNHTVYVFYELMLLLWSIIHTFNLIMTIEPCHLTYVEMEVTHELVSRLMRRTHSVYDPLAVELEQFCRQLVLNDITYSAFDLTTITRALLLNIFGSITTYLVIITQIK